MDTETSQDSAQAAAADSEQPNKQTNEPKVLTFRDEEKPSPQHLMKPSSDPSAVFTSFNTSPRRPGKKLSFVHFETPESARGDLTRSSEGSPLKRFSSEKRPSELSLSELFTSLGPARLSPNLQVEFLQAAKEDEDRYKFEFDEHESDVYLASTGNLFSSPQVDTRRVFHNNFAEIPINPMFDAAKKVLIENLRSNGPSIQRSSSAEPALPSQMTNPQSGNTRTNFSADNSPDTSSANISNTNSNTASSPATSFTVSSVNSSNYIDAPVLKLTNVPVEATVADVRNFLFGGENETTSDPKLLAAGIAQPIRLLLRENGKPQTIAFVETSSFTAAQFLLSARNGQYLQVANKPGRFVTLAIVPHEQLMNSIFLRRNKLSPPTSVLQPLITEPEIARILDLCNLSIPKRGIAIPETAYERPFYALLAIVEKYPWSTDRSCSGFVLDAVRVAMHLLVENKAKVPQFTEIAQSFIHGVFLCPVANWQQKETLLKISGLDAAEFAIDPQLRKVIIQEKARLPVEKVEAAAQTENSSTKRQRRRGNRVLK